MSESESRANAVSGVVDRPRLYDVLASPLVSVCIVQGPSGSGKTTLMRSWAAQSGERLTWVALGDGEITRQAFWRHVVGSARRLGDLTPDAAERVIEQLTAAADPVRIATDLLRDAGPVTLVFDAYEHLGDVAPEIDEDLARLVHALPDLRLFITTRGHTSLTDIDPPHGVVRIVSMRELAMSTDEISDLMVTQTGINDHRLAQTISEATHGFALTVRAIVLALSQLGRVPRVNSTEWDSIVAARWEALLPDPSALAFVIATSVPPYLDLELAGALSGHPDPTSTFAALERNGFGRWIPYRRQSPVFQYAETIRATFRAKAMAEPERFAALCSLTAQWLLKGDEPDQALTFAIEGGDLAFADRAFVALVIGNPDSYISDRFLPTLQRVPEERLPDYPMLAFGLGLALAANPMLRLDAPRVFQMAVDSTAAPAYVEPSIDAFSISAMKAVARRTAFDFRGSATAALSTVRSLSEIDPGLVLAYGDHVGTILRQLSYSLLQGGLIEDAITTAVRSVSLCTTQTARNYSIVYASGSSAFAGDLTQARAFSTSIDLDAWPVELRRSYMNGMGIVAEAYKQLDAIDFDGALETLRATDSYTPTGEFWPFFAGIQLSARLGLGHARAEADRLARVLSGPTPPGTGDNAATEHLKATLARAWIVSGDHRTAGELLDAETPDRPLLGAARIARHLADERIHDAVAVARTALDLPGHTLRSRADTRTVGAAAALRAKDEDLAWLWLTGAVLDWESSGPRLHVALLTPRDRRLLWDLAAQRGDSSVRAYLELPTSAVQTGLATAADLTRRESIVLMALADGGSIADIAARLVVSPHTVKTQLQGIYRKLGVSSRNAAIAVAQELGILRELGN